MKKYIGMILIVITFGFININGVKAHTIDDVLELVKDSEYVKVMETDGKKFRSIWLGERYYLNIEDEENPQETTSTVIIVEDDVISYQYLGNKDLEEESTTQAVVDGFFIAAIVESVAKLNGYTEDEIVSFMTKDKEILKDYTFEKNGLEITIWQKANETSSIQAYDTVKIDINNFRLKQDNNDSKNTLEDVINKLEESELYKNLNDKDYNLSTTIESTNDLIKITHIDEENKTFITKFTFADDVISYKYEGNKENLTAIDIEQTLIDEAWIKEIANIIVRLNGYTDEMLKNVEYDSHYTLAENGLEIYGWTYKQSSETGHMTITGIDTFKMNINNLKLRMKPEVQPDDKKEEKPNITTEVKNEVETTITPNPKNPSTGISIPIISLGALGLISMICLFISNKNKKFIKL